ncbi:RNA-binding S4 domain-containing protein [Rhizobium oryzicola]|uniref:RNA-binding S4 domain-containing protein n=1 Tax=Rhizobium oryzicola TaxID=1232668 RepID=A0ABT8T3L5_9HYPH|nr:RNA-binding S4 domain-containing protein [Rhizobium oryzicola]MDO1585181.1 RNA-binding S4 domain-containing protein [Rhizobium oryzicola]
MPETPLGDQRQRIDKWLFFSRIVKSRSLAQELVQAGFVRVNGEVISQPSRMIRVGDRLDLQLERRDIILIIKGAGERRGPFSEARLLYEDVSSPQLPLTAFERAQRRL